MSSIPECVRPDNCCIAECFQADCIKDAILDHLLKVLTRGDSSEPPKSVKRESLSIDSIFMHPEASCQKTSSTCVVPECPILFGRGSFDWFTYDDYCLYMCDTVTFKKLQKLLELLDVKHKGVASPYLYCWRGHYKLAWEVEEQKTSCLNDLPSSLCRVSFVLKVQQSSMFEFLVSRLLNLNFKHWNSLNLFGHTSVLAVMSRNEFKMLACSMIFCEVTECRLCPFEGVTFSSILHEVPAVVREVRMVQEFYSSACPCLVKPDPDDGENVINGVNKSASSSDVLPYELKLSSEIELGEFTVKKETEDNELLNRENAMEISENPLHSHEGQDSIENTKVSVRPSFSSKSLSHVRHTCTCVGPELLQCPECFFIVKCGEDRVERLLQHVRKSHAKRSKIISQSVRKLYPFMPCPLNPVNTLKSKSKLAFKCSLLKSSKDL